MSWELDSDFALAISKFEEYFCTETLTLAISNTYSEKEYNTEFMLRDKLIKIAISKAHA